MGTSRSVKRRTLRYKGWKPGEISLGKINYPQRAKVVIEY